MGQQIMDIEVQNMHLKHSKVSFDVQKRVFERCFKTKMIFKNVIEVPVFFSGSISIQSDMIFHET